MKYLSALAVLTVIAFSRTVTAQTTKEQVPFMVFDNMAYSGKPDSTGYGLVPSCVVYNQWKEDIAAGRLPGETAFKDLIRKKVQGHPGPVVIDIEYAYLSQTKGTTDAQVKQHFKLFIALAKWAREAAPGHLVGYYGHGLFPEEPGEQYSAETRELISAVDAFFPSMYVYGNQTDAQWNIKLQFLLQKARKIAPGKRVYPYLWPQYHQGAPRALEFVSGDFMKSKLETARAFGADGVVLWSSRAPAWSDAPWWRAILEFVAGKPACVSNARSAQPDTVGAGHPPAFKPE